MAAEKLDQGGNAWEGLANAGLEGVDNSCRISLRPSDGSSGRVTCDREFSGVDRAGFGSLVRRLGGRGGGGSCLSFEGALVC